MSNWIENLKKEVRSVTDNSIEQWAEVVKNMGLEGDDRRKWEKAVLENVTSLFNDMVEEVEGQQEKLTAEITGMLKKCEEYCKDLGTPMLAFEKKKLSFYDERTILGQKIAELENTLELRKQRYEALRKKVHELCTVLGIEIPKHEQEILYSEAFLSSLESQVETLETTKYERIERFLALQEHITDLLKELKLQPQLTFQKKLLDLKGPVGMLKESDLKNVVEYYEFLQNRAEDMRAEIEQLRAKIEDLWGTFNLDIQERHLLRQKFVGNSFETLRGLKDEVRRCEVIRKANMQERQRKLSARKQAREQLTITPGKSTLSLFPSSSTQNLATVSGNQRLIATPLTNARKRTKLDFGTRKRAALKPPTSEEKPKRKGLKAMKRHRLSKSLETFPQNENEYAMFERDMQNKDAAARSTIFADTSRPVTPLAVPLGENTLRRTPTAPSMSRSPRKVNNKLTAVSHLKLIF